MKRRSFFKSIASLVGVNVLLRLDSVTEIPVKDNGSKLDCSEIDALFAESERFFSMRYDSNPYRITNAYLGKITDQDWSACERPVQAQGFRNVREYNKANKISN